MFEKKSERQYIKEVEEIGTKNLMRWHSLFYQFFLLGEVRITDKIPTAAVSFDKEGRYMEFWFNPDFWDSLDNDEAKEFVICHEILHVLYKHGVRGKDIDKLNRHLANVVMDIEVNHCLVDKFRFRQDVKLPIEPIWVDKVFKPEDNVERGREFEYYFKKAMEILPKVEVKVSGLSTIDQHGLPGDNQDGSSGPNPIPDRALGDIIDAVRESMSREENEKLKSWGLEEGFDRFIARWKKIKVKKGWDSIRVTLSMKGTDIEENWIMRDRRHLFLPTELFLPGKSESDEVDNARVNLWFFQDISGSCISYVDFFFNAALTFPEERFHVRMHSFDTQVRRISKDTRLYGGGGTCFQAIENYVNKETQGDKDKYPDAIFVFSDGEAAQFTCKHPEKWFWFLEGSYQTSAIPQKSTIFNIRDFVEENK